MSTSCPRLVKKKYAERVLEHLDLICGVERSRPLVCRARNLSRVTGSSKGENCGNSADLCVCLGESAGSLAVREGPLPPTPDL